MKALIIEDEPLARNEIERLIATHFPQLEVAQAIGSVAKSIAWLIENEENIDLIFSDVELSDGNCFEIYNKVNVSVPIIFTTAYNEYAIKAFKVNGVDYLLKPLDEQEFILAVSKCIKRINSQHHQHLPPHAFKNDYRTRFTIKLGDKLIIVPLTDIAFFYSEDKATYIVTKEGKQHITEHSLDTIERELDPNVFFRLSRNAITTIGAIKSITKHFNSRLKVILTPTVTEYILVSRLRTADFTRWLEGR